MSDLLDGFGGWDIDSLQQRFWADDITNILRIPVPISHGIDTQFGTSLNMDIFRFVWLTI